MPRAGDGVSRGTGFQPVHSAIGPVRLPGRNREDTGVEIRVRNGAFLPHWSCDGGVYAVTFRLADSLPQTVLSAWVRERGEILRRAVAAKRSLSPVEIQRLHDLFSKRVEAFLDRGYGDCLLKHDRAAGIVCETLKHFDGQRYDLVAWCVMPNHVHAVVHPRVGIELSAICHSWKSYSANQINRLLRRRGSLWQPEPYDHLIRNEEDYRYAVDYTLANPKAAGLGDWPWIGRGTGFQPVTDAIFGSSTAARWTRHPSELHGQDGRATDSSKAS